MNVLHHLFGRSVHLRHHRHLAGTGAYTTALRIEPEYQDALEALVGGRSSEGAQHECTAFLVPEPEDLDLPGSVAVHIAGYRVGTLSGPEGERYRRFLASTGRGGVALCDALVTGGWLREEGEGYFAVHLDLAWPLHFNEDVPLEVAA
jgi:hypothetical protein